MRHLCSYDAYVKEYIFGDIKEYISLQTMSIIVCGDSLMSFYLHCFVTHCDSTVDSKMHYNNFFCNFGKGP